MQSDLKTRLESHKKMGGIRHQEVIDDIKKAILDFKNCIKIMNKINSVGIIKNIDNDDYKIKEFYQHKYDIEIFEINELILKIFGDFEKEKSDVCLEKSGKTRLQKKL